MKETFHIFWGTPRNASWEESVEGLSNVRERMEHLATTRAGKYFLLSIGTCSILAQTETFSQPTRAGEGKDQRSPAQQFFDELCDKTTPDSQ